MENESAIDPKLQNQINSLRLLAMTHKILGDGLYQVHNATAVNQCLAFIQNLHEQCIADASSHPDSDKIEELKKYKEGKNGTT